MNASEIAMQLTLKAIEIGAVKNNKVAYESSDEETERFSARVCKMYQDIYNTAYYAENTAIKKHTSESKN